MDQGVSVVGMMVNASLSLVKACSAGMVHCSHLLPFFSKVVSSKVMLMPNEAEPSDEQ